MFSGSQCALFTDLLVFAFITANKWKWEEMGEATFNCVMSLFIRRHFVRVGDETNNQLI